MRCMVHEGMLCAISIQARQEGSRAGSRTGLVLSGMVWCDLVDGRPNCLIDSLMMEIASDGAE